MLHVVTIRGCATYNTNRCLFVADYICFGRSRGREMHVYEVLPCNDKHGHITFAIQQLSGLPGETAGVTSLASQTQSVMQSATQSFTAGRMML
jgi:hypothetical protein